MQTFFSEDTVETSLKVLDYRRLGKQRVEGYRILRTLTGLSTGWKQHPAVKMWRGFEPALLDYTLTACELWVHRGYCDTLADKLFEEFGDLIDEPIVYPPWVQNRKVIDSHKAMLFHNNPKSYAHYKAYSHITDYVWPV